MAALHGKVQLLPFKNFIYTVSLGTIFLSLSTVTAAPKESESKTPRQLFHLDRTPDGGIAGSFGFSEAVNLPGMSSSIADSTTFSIGPQGASFANSGSQSMDIGLPGFKSGFSNANANAFSAGPRGFSHANANAASLGFQSPFNSNSLSNANSNAFSGGFNGPPSRSYVFR